MKKMRRILAMGGVILLLALYAATLIFALMDHTDTMMMFKASVLATAIIPILLWAYGLVFRLTRSDQPTFSSEESSEESSDSTTDVQKEN